MQKQAQKDIAGQIKKFTEMLASKQKNQSESKELLEKLKVIDQQVAEIGSSCSDLQQELTHVEE